jgi:hypothetical protein
MPEVNRRRFLQLAGGTAGFTALSESIAKAAAIPAGYHRGTIEDVEHIVVLMQENRSFDHYFGALRGVRGFGDPHPVTLDNGKSVWHQSDGTKEMLPFHPEADDLGMQFLEGLPHSWPDGHAAYNGGKYDKWVPAKGATTMAYLTREDIPFHYALADTFTVCDAYHCSFIGSTDPNRYYMWTGFTGNDGKGGGPVLGNDEVGYDWTTYPERLEKAGISWKIYQDIGDGLDAAGSWGWIDGRVPRQLRRQLAALLQQVPQRQGRRPAVRQGPHRHRRAQGARATSTSCGPTSRAASCRRSPGSPPPRRSPSTPTGPELRRLVHLPGPGRAHLRPQGVGEDGPVHHVRRERRLLRPPRPAAAAARRRARASPPSTSARTSSRGARRTSPARTVSARACRCSSSRPGARAATSAPRPSTTPRSSGSWSAASASRSRTSRPGGGPSAAT